MTTTSNGDGDGDRRRREKKAEVKSLRKEEGGSSSSDTNNAGDGEGDGGFEDSEGMDLWSDTSSMPYVKRSDRYRTLEAKYNNLIHEKKSSSSKGKYGRRKLLKLFCF